jgi:hypothetical protein
MMSSVAVTGYSRLGVKLEDLGLGQGMSAPFWQVRWAYGPNYGINGSMWIEKWNGSREQTGPCDIHRQCNLPIMKKY